MIVVKIGGRALQKNFEELIRSIHDVAIRGEKVIIIHGGGNEIDDYAKKMNIESKYVVSPSGIRSRLTTKEELDVVIMVLAGLINKKIVHALLNKGLRTIGISGLDGKLIEGKKRDKIVIIDEKMRKRVIDAGFTGKIERVNIEILKKLLESFDVIVVSPIIYHSESPLNTDADYFASKLACEIKTDALVYLTDTDGVIINGKLLTEIDASKKEDLINLIGPGMNRKVMHAIDAYICGVKKVIISNGTITDPLQKALSSHGSVIINGKQRSDY